MLPDRVKNNQLPERIQKKIKPEVIQQIEEHEEFDKGQLQTLAMKCKGKDKCPYGIDCPLDKPKLGNRCQLEIYYQEKWFDDYIASFGLEPSNKTYTNLVVSLVQVEVQLMRQQSIIQEEGFQQTVVTETADGKKRYDKKLHNVLTLIEQLENRKVKILKELKGLQTQTNTEQIVGDLAKLFQKQ